MTPRQAGLILLSLAVGVIIVGFALIIYSAPEIAR